MAVLEKGEAILDQKKQNTLMSIIGAMNKLSAATASDVPRADLPRVFSDINPDTIQAAAQAPSIQFGDVIINGASEDTVKKHAEINRKFVNDVLDIFNLKK